MTFSRYHELLPTLRRAFPPPGSDPAQDSRLTTVISQALQRLDAELGRAIAEQGQRPVLLVTTLRRILRINSPEAAERIERDWREIRSFPGTIGGGRITIWSRRRAAAEPRP